MRPVSDMRTGETGAGHRAGVRAELIVGGMSCGSCAARIERRLNKLDGVTASVNYATGRAYFSGMGGREPAELIGVIESCGYSAEAPAADTGPDDPAANEAARALGRRLAVCVPLAVAVIVLAMVPAVQFSGWPWVSLVLATPVAVWGAWPLHRTAWAGARPRRGDDGHPGQHGGGRVVRLVGLHAVHLRRRDMSMRMSLTSSFGLAGSHPLYLDVAAGVPAAVLAGRYLEARARARSGAALTALAGLGAKTVAVLRNGTEQRVAVETLEAGELFVVRPGEKIATDGVITEGRSAVDVSLVTGESTPAEVGPGRRGDRRDAEHERAAGGAGHPRRRGHAAGADHPAGRRGAGNQGVRAAAGRPGRRGLRPVRDQPRRGHARILAGRRACA